MDRKMKVFKRYSESVTPDRFGVYLDETKDKSVQITIVFGKTNFEDNTIDLKSETLLDVDGFKTVLKRMLDVAEEVRQKTNRDVLDEILKLINKEGANNEK